MNPTVCHVPLRRGTVVLLTALLSVGGCGQPGPKTVPVKGQVELRGGKGSQLAGGFVELQSTTDEALRPRGPIEEDGSFTIGTLVGGTGVEGAPPGSYRARVEPPAETAIAPRFRDFRTSGLTFTIQEGDNPITITVDRARP